MRLSSIITFRTFFLLGGLLCFAGIAAAHSLNIPPLTNPRGALTKEIAGAQSLQPSVSAGDFSISANPTSLTVPLTSTNSAGSVDGSITLTGMNGFDGNVTLSCSVMGGSGQNQPTCFFPAIFPANQILVDASQSASTTAIEVDTVPGMCTVPVFCAVPNIFGGGSSKFQTAAIVLVLLAFSTCFCRFLSKRTRAASLCVVFICVAGLAMAGCTNGPSGALADGCPPGLGFTGGTPAGMYTVAVVGTNGNLVHSITIPVTVPAQ